VKKSKTLFEAAMEEINKNGLACETPLQRKGINKVASIESKMVLDDEYDLTEEQIYDLTPPQADML
jgi:hypothetical protein